MTFLIIETSSEKSFISLCIRERVINAHFLPDREQSKKLLPTLKSLLSKENIALNQLDFIAVGKGPGSFTGTRIGVMTAKALSFAQSIPLVPFCSLASFSPKGDGSFTTIIDARSHGFYLLQGVKKKKECSFLENPRLIQRNALAHTMGREETFISPHPEKVTEAPKTVFQASIDLSLLAKYLYATYLEGKTCTHAKLTVSYLAGVNNFSNI